MSSPLTSIVHTFERLSWGSMWWNQPQGRKENHVLVFLVQDSFLATFLLPCYNDCASIINKSSAPALNTFLQLRTKYSMVCLQLILHLSVHGPGAHFGSLLAGWVLLRWDWSVPNIFWESDGWSYFCRLFSLSKCFH